MAPTSNSSRPVPFSLLHRGAPNLFVLKHEEGQVAEFERIAKSKMSGYSKKRQNRIVAHLSSAGWNEPLCQANTLARGAHWTREGDPDFKPDRDCTNCLILAEKMGVR
jgi:hypothetical protein